MAVGINPNKCFRYILESDRKLAKKDQTVFLIKPVRASQYKELISGYAPESLDFDKVYVLLNSCVTGWENLRDQDGENILFKENSLTDNWDCLTLPQITELSKAILEFNIISGEERKN